MKRILRESITNDQAFALYKNMSQVEKTGWWEAIKLCIEELGYGKISRSDIAVTVFGVGLIVMGVKLDIPELCVMGAGSLGILTYFEKDVWKKIIDCARNKRKGGTTTNKTTEPVTPEKTIQESKMKKTIRLTESELVKLVQRIIKEDEMGVNPCREASLQKSTTLRKIFKNKITKKVYAAEVNGSTPFCVSNKDGLFTEMKKDIKLQPDTPIFSKNCQVDVYPLVNGMAAGEHLYFHFNNGVAS
jgi:hypothetical protein